MAHADALALARTGRLQAARSTSQRAVELAMQDNEREAAAGYRAARAVWEALCGNSAEAAKTAGSALELSKGRDVTYASGLALALSGELPRAEALVRDLAKRFPEDTFTKFTYVPALRGRLALQRGKAESSIEELEMARSYELAVNGLNFPHLVLGGLHSAHVRGEALTAARRYGEAAAEFQRILEQPGIVGSDPISALAHRQLGRLYALAGDRMRAKISYERFLVLWKDADADIPVLKRAKEELGRLQ